MANLKLYQIFLVTIIIFIVAVFLFLTRFSLQKEEGKPAPLYHFGLVAGNINQPIWQEIYEGALQYADNNGIAVDFLGPEYFNLDEHVRWVEIAGKCRLDGLIFPAYSAEPYSEIISELKSDGIPVITVMYDLPESERSAYVGVDPEDLGDAAALLIDEAVDGDARIAVIRDSIAYDRADPVIRGITAATDRREDLVISTVEISPFGIFSAESISRRIILEQTKINAFFCDSIDTTLGVTQMVIDMNRVGDIAIVGFMRNDEVDRYLHKKIISGIIHTDSYEIGRRAVSILHDLKEGRHVSSFNEVGFSLIFTPREY